MVWVIEVVTADTTEWVSASRRVAIGLGRAVPGDWVVVELAGGALNIAKSVINESELMP